MLGQTSSHNPERISNEQLSAGNEMDTDTSNPENRLPGLAVPLIFGEHNNHDSEAETNLPNPNEATSNEDTSIQPLSLMTEPMSEEEKHALKIKRDNEILASGYLNRIYRVTFRGLTRKIPNELINSIYNELIRSYLKDYRNHYNLFKGDSTPQNILYCLLTHDELSSSYTKQERLEQFDWLIRAGARADVISEDGRSYLCIAVAKDKRWIVKALLKGGLNTIRLYGTDGTNSQQLSELGKGR